MDLRMKQERASLLSRLGGLAGYAGLLALFATFGYYAVFREFGIIPQALAAAGVVFLAFFLWSARSQVTQTVKSRQAQRGTNAVVMTVAFIGIVALLNVLVARNPVRWDLTETGEYTLSPQTRQILANLDQPVHVIGFYTAGNSNRATAEGKLREYAVHTDKLTYEFVDPDTTPTLAQRYQIRTEGLVFLSGDRRQDVQGVSESDITNGILKVTSDKQAKVAFVTGHGERQIDGFDQQAYSRAKAALEDDNYVVTTLNLATETIGDDISAVILAGPQQPLLDQERDVLNDYLRRGGKLMLLIDPRVDANVDALLANYGISLGRDLVIDPERALFSDAGVPVIIEYGWSQITKDLPQTVFPGVAALTLPSADNTPDGVTVSTLARTSPGSWAEKALQNPRFDEGVDAKGPLTIAATVEAPVKQEGEETEPDQAETDTDEPKKTTRIVVVGDSDFASDTFISMVGNRDFFVNSVNWLTENEELISIRPKPPTDRSIFLTATQANLVIFSSVVVLPLIVLIAGASVWWSRR